MLIKFIFYSWYIALISFGINFRFSESIVWSKLRPRLGRSSTQIFTKPCSLSQSAVTIKPIRSQWFRKSVTACRNVPCARPMLASFQPKIRRRCRERRTSLGALKLTNLTSLTAPTCKRLCEGPHSVHNFTPRSHCIIPNFSRLPGILAFCHTKQIWAPVE